MTVECDHDNTATPFCPHCGEPLSAAPLYQLRAHLMATLSRQTKEAQRRRELEADGKYARGPEWVRSAEQMARKWAVWIEALDELLEART